MTQCTHEQLNQMARGWCPDCEEPVDHRLICPRGHVTLEADRMACPGCGLQVPADGGWPGLPHQWEQLELLMQIGRGNLGVVYAAREGSGELVAVRIVPRPGEAAWRIKSANTRECEYAGRFPQYDGLLKARAQGVGADGDLFLTMDLCRGESLAEVLGQPDPDADALNPRRAGDPLSPLRTVRLLRHVIGAAARMHRFKLIHRDIKPSNLFLVESDRGDGVKLGDLGRAWPWDPEGDDAADLPAPGPLDPALISRTTAPYLSPEVVRGERRLSPASDIYSAGVVAYEACTGRLPYRVSKSLIGEPVAGLQRQLSPTLWGDFAAAWLRAHLLADLVPPREIIPDLPPSLERCLLTCRARRPEDRFQRAGDVIIQLALVERERRCPGGRGGRARCRGRRGSSAARCRRSHGPGGGSRTEAADAAGGLHGSGPDPGAQRK